MTGTRLSKGIRWANAASRARIAWDSLDTVLGELEALKAEYEDQRDTTPELLQRGATYEKLEVVAETDIVGPRAGMRELVEKLVGMDLPLGYGMGQ